MARRLWFERRFPLGLGPEALPDVVERLRGTPLRLEERCRGAAPLVRVARPASGGWSLQEHAGHLGDLEPLWLARLDDFAAGLATLREADLQNRGTWEAGHGGRPLDDVLDTFRRLRGRLVERVSALDGKALAATAAHPRLGEPMTVVDLCFFVAEHDDHHLAAITALRDPSPPLTTPG